MCGGGARLPSAAAKAAGWGLSGLEFGINIPGTVGGAVRMNANAYGGELGAGARVGERVQRRRRRAPRARASSASATGARTCGQGEVVSRASFRLAAGDPAEIKAELARMRAARREAQPSGIKTFGSTFTNPDPGAAGVEGRTAGQLLEAAGCRGMRRGGARFSEAHANFVENEGEATTADVLELMALGRRRVHESFGVVLEPEVQVLGEVEWPRPGSSRPDGAVAADGAGDPVARPTAGRRGPPAVRRPRTARVWLRRLAVIAALGLALAAAYMLWFRDSSLVAVKNVKIEGLSSITDPERRRFARARGARDDDAASRHPQPRRGGERLSDRARHSASTPGFPSSLTITVTERVPVASTGDSATPVAADGVTAARRRHRPRRAARDRCLGRRRRRGARRRWPRAGGRDRRGPGRACEVIEQCPYDVTGGRGRADGRDLAAVRRRIRAGDKWAAAARILADPAISALDYIDLRVADRPAVGGAVPGAGMLRGRAAGLRAPPRTAENRLGPGEIAAVRRPAVEPSS